MRFRYLFAIVVAGVMAIYSALFREYHTINQAQAVYATAIVVLGALPGIISLVSRRESDLVPLMPLHGLFYAITFGLPVFSNKTIWLVSDSDTITEALLFTIFGLFCLYLGYYAFRGVSVKVRPILRFKEISPSRKIFIAWVLYGFYLLFELFPSLLDTPSIGQLYAPLGYLSIGILSLLALDKVLSKFQIILLYFIIILTLLLKTLSGFLAPPVFLLVFLGIIYWNKRRSIPLSLVVGSVLIMVTLNPIKSTFRAATWNKQGGSMSYSIKAELLYQAAKDFYSGGDVFSLVKEDASTVNRLAHISLFSYVINKTPNPVPYWMGGSYQTLWTSFIPRLVWSDKPEARIGNIFGQRYNLLDSNDQNTSYNLPWLPEFYANFGLLGVLIGMFSVGALFRFLVQKFTSPISHTLEYILGLTIIFNMFYAESNFALQAGGIFLTYIIFRILLYLLTFNVPSSNYDYMQ